MLRTEKLGIRGLDLAKKQVEAFHTAFGHPVGHEPQPIAEDLALSRTVWTGEELVEFLYATANNDLEKFNDMFAAFLGGCIAARDKIIDKGESVEDVLVAQADALTDVNYFVQGSFVVMGVDPQPLFDIVQEANMSKLFPDGKPRFDENNGGKIIKPLGWEAPEPKLHGEIERQKMNS